MQFKAYTGNDSGYYYYYYNDSRTRLCALSL